MTAKQLKELDPDKELLQQRIKTLKDRLKENYKYLAEWEDELAVAGDPTEIRRTTQKIAHVKEIIAKDQKELRRLRSPQKRKRWWQLATLFGLLVLLSTVVFLYSFHVSPDYGAYRKFLEQGDSLLQKQQIPEAREAFKKAARYNPFDSAVIKKLRLLDSADQHIKNKEFTAVGNLISMIISIPASPTLSKGTMEKLGIQSNPPITIKISWNANQLTITVSGGVPYKNEQAPYEIAGFTCDRCVQWKKTEIVYIAIITGSKWPQQTIKITDRYGQFSEESIPAQPVSPVPPKPTNTTGDQQVEKTTPVTPSTQPTEEVFEQYMKKGDSLFAMKKYEDAKGQYSVASKRRPGEGKPKEKIEECDKMIRELARAIPRVSITGGTFTMGTDDGNPDDGPAHKVSLRNFLLGKTEVTQDQYRKYCQYTGNIMPDQPSNEASQPVVNITWNEARAYCNWVGGRLPTEAEWEYAAGAGLQTLYSGGANINSLGWYSVNSDNKANPVARKSPNRWQLYDMTGNVAEWCADWFGRKTYQQLEADNPQGPPAGTERIIRGGAYNSFVKSSNDGNQLRITYRNSQAPAAAQTYIGFRVAWSN